MFRATYEHILYIDSFKNIDLYQQGLYYLRFSISLNSELATPYNFFEVKQKKKDQQQNWVAAQIEEDAHIFHTKTFMIRFQEEEVEIDEGCVFKIEVAGSQHYEWEFKLQCDLMCADLSKIGGPPSEDESLFNIVATYEAIIYNSYKGVHEYIPILFDSHHFCLVNCMLHSTLSDFKFRALENNQSKGTRHRIFSSPKTFLEFLQNQTDNFQKCQDFFDYYVGQLKETCESFQFEIGKLCGKLKLYDLIQKLPIIPKFSYVQYKESQILDFNKSSNKNGVLLIRDVLNPENTKDQQLLTTLIETDFFQFASTLFDLQNMLIQIIQKNPKAYKQLLIKEFQEKFKEQLGEFYLRETIKCESFSIGTSYQKQHEQIAEQLRKKPQIIEPPLQVQQENKGESTVIFEEIFQRDSNNYVNPHNTHLVVLVHGFQGNSLDMRMIRNNLQIYYPNHHYLMSKHNEEMTDGNIADMGRNLGQEVKQYINDYIKTTSFKLTFIGHSLGGVIIRAALPHLIEYKVNMYTFVSLSSPHLGYGYNNSLLIDAGLWFLKRMRKSISLQQLAMTDASELENTFLYKLSKAQGLNWFQHVMLVSSTQDSYVPYDSARIQKNFLKNDQRNSKKYERMVDSILHGMRATSIKRVDVNFVLNENRKLDNMIGRSAHIMFLDNDQFLRMLITCVDDIFN